MPNSSLCSFALIASAALLSCGTAGARPQSAWHYSPRATAFTVVQPPAKKWPSACTESQDFIHADRSSGADGIVDAVLTRTFDDAGRTRSEAWEWGSTERREEQYEYNDRGSLVRRTLHQQNAIGHILEVVTYSYDREGRCVREDTDESSGPQLPSVDGRVDWRTERTYDSHGRLAKLHELINARNGRGGVIFWYYYDDHSLLLRKEGDNEGTGRPRFDTFFRYDDHQHLLEERTRWRDTGADGDHNYYHYDEQGRLISRSGQYETRRTYEYDEAGNLLREARYLAGGRVLEMRTVYNYDCWRSRPVPPEHQAQGTHNPP